MSTNWPNFQAQVYNAVAAASSAADWAIEFPNIIDRAEQRCYRDLDMFGVRLWLINGNGFIPNSRYQFFPTSTYSGLGILSGNMPFGFGVTVPISIDAINAINTPSPSSSGARQILTRVSPQFIDLNWPADSSAFGNGIPSYYAMVSDQVFMVGPPPALAYAWEMRGPVRPLSLSSNNSSTPLTFYYSDLFWCAAMIEAGQYMRFVEPQMAATWLQEYQLVLGSAQTEEMRKRNMAEGWLSYQPSKIATPPRT